MKPSSRESTDRYDFTHADPLILVDLHTFTIFVSTYRHVNAIRYIDQIITKLYGDLTPSSWGIYHPKRASNNDPNAVNLT